MAYLPSIVEAHYQSGYIVRLTFDNGTKKSVDVSQFFIGPVFEPIKEITTFQKLYVEAGALSWPSGVDISPEALYEAEEAQKAA